MADSVIGAIRAILQLDTAAFTSGAKEAESTLASLEKAFKKTAAALGVGLSVGFAVKEFQHAVDAADELNKASQKFGVGVEALSGLKYAAELADVSFESLGKGLKKLAVATTDAIIKPNSDAAASFATLGISMDDIKDKSPEQVLLKVADAFSKFEDDATKTKIAVALFGKAGADLIPLLNQGADGIRHATDEAAKLGITVKGEAAKAAEDFNDALKAMGKIVPGIANSFLTEFTPEIIRATNAMKDFIDTGKFKEFQKQVSGNIKSDVKDFDFWSNAIANTGTVFKNFFSLIATNTAPDEFLKRQQKLIASLFDLANTAKQTHVDIDILPLARSLDAAEQAMTQTGKAAKEKLNPGLIEATKYIADTTEKLDKQVVQLKAHAGTVELSAGAQAKAQIIADFFSKTTALTTEELYKQYIAILKLAEGVQKYTDATSQAQAQKGLREGLEAENVSLKAQIDTLGQSAGAREKVARTRQIELQIQQQKLPADTLENKTIQDNITLLGQQKNALDARNFARQADINSQKLQAGGELAIQAALNPSIAATAQLKFVTDQLIDAKARGQQNDQLVIASIMQEGKAVGDNAVAMQAAQLIISNRTPYDNLMLQEQQHQEILKQYPSLYAEVAAAQAKTDNQMLQMKGQAVSALLSATSQVFMALGAQNKQAFETGKAFAIAAATVNSFLAFTKVLSVDPLPPPFNYIAAGATLAAGLAQVIQIKNQKYTGAALGGSFKVPGGMMGVDKRLVPMALAPGERVDVTPASQVGRSGDRVLSIPAINPRDFFAGDTVRYMVESIDRWMRDGGTGIRMVPR